MSFGAVAYPARQHVLALCPILWFGRSHVTIAESDWLYYTTIFPVTRNVIDPETGASFRFDYVRFGRDWREFGLWGWTVRTHEWVRAVGEMADPDERAAAFLREWIDLTLRRGEIPQVAVRKSLAGAFPGLAAGGGFG